MRFLVMSAINCEKVKKPEWGEVGAYTNLQIIEQSFPDVVRQISLGNRAYDLPIAHAIVALLGKRMIML